MELAIGTKEGKKAGAKDRLSRKEVGRQMKDCRLRGHSGALRLNEEWSQASLDQNCLAFTATMDRKSSFLLLLPPPHAAMRQNQCGHELG